MGSKEKLKKDFGLIVRKALKEDIGRGDITTDSIVTGNERALGVIFSKEEGILCGIDLAEMVFKTIDERIDFQKQLADGDTLSPGVTIAGLIGPAAACLKGERTALNFLQHLSGIATLTKKFVEATEGKIKILDTRKTLAGLRTLEKYAVRVGGGNNHRFGLYDMVLIKDNHIEIAGSISEAVKRVRAKRKRTFVEVEVKTFEELKEAISLKVNRVMFDNMNRDQLIHAVAMVRQAKDHIEIEVSGGIGLENIKDFADCGADYISIGALTHSAPAIDIALKMKALSPEST